MRIFEKSKTSKKENDKRKYKKSNNSDGENSGDDDGNHKSDSESSVQNDKKGRKSKSGKKSSTGGKSDEQQFDMQEYRKMLADMFPSKYITKRVENIENSKERAIESIYKDLNIETQEKHLDECDSRPSKTNENKKGKKTGSDEKNTKSKTTNKKDGNDAKDNKDTKDNKSDKNKYNTRSKSKKRGSNNPEPPVSPSDEEDDSGSDNKTWRTASESGSGSGSETSTSTTCSDDSGDESYEPGFNEFAKDQLKNGKFNIVINLVDDKRRHSDSDSENDNDDDDDDDYDDEDDSEYDSEYDDDEEDYDSEDESESDNDHESDLDYEPSETSEEIEVYDPKHKYRRGHKHRTNDKGNRAEKNKKKDESNSTGNNSDSLETILRIKQQMEDILKINKHDSIARETLQSMIRKEKEFKEREEQKLRSHKKKHVKNFKKLLRQKNSTNDLKYFKEHLSMDEQSAVLSELQCLNKLTITDKPYRLALLQSNIPQEFKAIALKKITNLRRMEPGAGEYYKIKNWVDTFMQIPFGRISNLPLTISDGIERCHEFMEDAKSKLDGAVYGLNDAKMQIMQMLGQWISNPSAMGTAIAINGPMGTGKCHTFDTPILMYDGSVKMVQDIVVGDKVMGDDSKCRNVLSLGRGEDDLYDIVHSNGEKYGVNSEHIMCLKQSGMNFIKNVKTKSGETRYKVCYFDKNDYKQHSKRFSDQTEAERYLHDMKLEHDYVEIPVKTLLTLPKYIRVNLKGYKRGVEFSSKNVPFDPYIIGAWLGDGTSSKSEITNQDATILHYLKTELKKYNLNLVHREKYTYGISYDMHEHEHDTRNNKNMFLQVLKDCKLINNKHIPDVYKINDRQTRLELLAGIIDTDGSYCDNSKGYDIIQKNKVLADDILFVARSLGFSANMSQCEKSCMYKGEKKTGTYYRMHLSGDNLSSIPVKCPRKMAKNERVINKDSMVMGIAIEHRGWGKYYGFELDKNHKYLLGDFTITHNTSLVKEGISKILNREFAFIPLGGATDSSYLEGHSYTYEGSTWGKIVDILIRSKSMNPVIYFDELDKISETPKGEEIIGILTHLTDTSQNSQFHDKYFAEIDFDLSKCLFIFSYNDPLKVNPILMDRMYKIKTSSYSGKEKIVIANQYLIPKIRYEVNFKEGDIIIPDATLNYIIENYTDKECGVRNLKRCIEIIYKKLNLYRLVKPGTTLFEKENTLVVEFPFHVTTDIVNNLIKKDDSGMSKSAINMYL
jgi:ATP-dependent Lon protease